MLFTNQCGVNGLCQQLPETATLISSPRLKHTYLPSGTVWDLGEESPEHLYPTAVAAMPDEAPIQGLSHL